MSGGVTVLIPVGPGDEEPARLTDLLASIDHHEPRLVRRVIVIDDAARPRDLAALGRSAPVTVVRTGLPKPTSHPYRAMLAGTLAGLHLAGRDGADVVVKMDTDALVVGPFAQRLLDAVDRQPDIGVFGSCEYTCNGGRRDWSYYRAPVPAAALPLPLMPGREAGRRLPLRATHPGRALARFGQLRRALANGYRLGEHCLGGAYAVSGDLATWLDREDNLRASSAWMDSSLGEDAVLGIVARAAGFGLGGAVLPDGPFALHHVGLPGTPGELVERGAGVVHSLRNDTRGSEDDLRQTFARLRAPALEEVPA